MTVQSQNTDDESFCVSLTPGAVWQQVQDMKAITYWK